MTGPSDTIIGVIGGWLSPITPKFPSMRYSLPGGWVVGLPSPVQVGVVSPSLVKV
jgi:hypothetical protein